VRRRNETSHSYFPVKVKNFPPRRREGFKMHNRKIRVSVYGKLLLVSLSLCPSPYGSRQTIFNF
jgi:hypothetical protein